LTIARDADFWPLLDTQRGRIIRLMRAGGRTADDLAATLGLTSSAVRLQLAALERSRIVKRTGTRRGLTRPSVVFELTDEIEQLLSHAYVPVLMHLVQLCAEELPGDRLRALLREAGRRIAVELAAGDRQGGSVAARVARASRILNERLGAVTHVETNGSYIIRGAGCPIAALTASHPGACMAVESLVTELVGEPVRECCDRSARPRCCFEIPRRARRGPLRQRGAGYRRQES
jgi:predicted ArsR family transcriptional regulator